MKTKEQLNNDLLDDMTRMFLDLPASPRGASIQVTKGGLKNTIAGLLIGAGLVSGAGLGGFLINSFLNKDDSKQIPVPSEKVWDYKVEMEVDRN